MPDPLIHPSLAELMAFCAGQLGPLDQAAVERHVSACPECVETLNTLPETPIIRLARQAMQEKSRSGVTPRSDPHRSSSHVAER